MTVLENYEDIKLKLVKHEINIVCFILELLCVARVSFLRFRFPFSFLFSAEGARADQDTLEAKKKSTLSDQQNRTCTELNTTKKGR